MHKIAKMYGVAAIFGGAAFAAASFGSSAEAAVYFTNRSDQEIIFTMTCALSDQTYRWVAAANETLSVRCLNGASSAVVHLYTRHSGGGRSDVRARVFDGLEYELYFDGVGDATISAA